ncbi:MAG: tRNA (adenosine(37)-N6)-dimethylallyltransferase MiaA [Candidatus Aminicenantes bacterium]|nr:tRNA (adenosine(37)-N6)-dimethylallyltransferase MiaA [Candidatus Aminicenantes bacterium]
MESKDKSLIIVLGPTSVGKSSTAAKLAKKIGGEIINCDSMQVYKGFDIGTDKIPQEKRGKIPHHLLDVVSPSTQFTAADFVRLTLQAIKKIAKKEKFPFIVGGTGLYLKALLDGLFPEGKRDPSIRKKLEKEAGEKGLESLREKLMKVDPAYCEKIGKHDKLRIIRALEVFCSTQIPLSEHFLKTESFVKDFNSIKIGLKLERQELYRRIEKRVDKMFEKGIVIEVQNLLQEGVSEKSPPFRALGYKYVLKFLKKEISMEDAIILTKRDTRHYAKRQMTWFRKIEGIKWFSPYEFPSILEYVQKSLI